MFPPLIRVFALSQKLFSHKEAQKAQKILLILELFVLLCG
jgi:hypothetical protein